jgi:hypothetical protein
MIAVGGPLGFSGSENPIFEATLANVSSMLRPDMAGDGPGTAPSISMPYKAVWRRYHPLDYG